MGKPENSGVGVHKTRKVLDKLPKHLQKKAKAELHDIPIAETKEEAEKAFDRFLAHYGVKYPKVAECLKKDRADLLTFYDFPAYPQNTLEPPTPLNLPLPPFDSGLIKPKDVFLDALFYLWSIVLLSQLKIPGKSWRE